MAVSAVVDFVLGEGAFAAGGFAAFAVATAYRIVVAMVIGSIVSRLLAKTPAQGYSRIQLPPNTYNKIPMVYGDAWMSPIVVDARISNDNMWMWYVLVYSEVSPNTDTFQTSWIANQTTTSTLSAGTVAGYPDIYWGDRYCYFENSDDGAMVTQWEANHGKNSAKREAAPNNHLWIYNFPNGSYFCENNTSTTAFEIMTDPDTGGGISNPWTATNIMNNLCFQIVKVNYTPSASLTGLPAITSLIHNYQKPTPSADFLTWRSPDPGTVLLDYFTNPTYGAGLPITQINTSSLAALTAYSLEPITFTDYSINYNTGITTTTNRYSINGPIDTTQKLLDNLQNISDCCDSWIAWNETTGQWGVVINNSATQVMRIGPDNIIGGITINPIDLNNTYNQVEVTYPNTIIKDQTSYYYLSIKDNFPNFGLGLNEPNVKLSMNLNYTNNQPQAAFLAARRLLLSRIDYTISFAMDFTGIQLEAGDVIGIDHDNYGWGRSTLGNPGDPNFWYDQTGATTSTGKLFRVQQVVETMQNNMLSAKITAITYNPNIYSDDNLQLESYRPPANAGLISAAIIGQPGQPYTPASGSSPTPEYPSQSVPYFIISGAMPDSGIVTSMELWAGLTTTTPFDTTWFKLDTAVGNGQNLPISTPGNTEYINFNITGLPAGSYYFATRCQGVAGYSQFSAVSDPVYTWNPATAAGTAVDSTNATNVNMNAGTGVYYITHSAGASGNQPQYASTNLTYDTANGVLASQSISLSSVATLAPLNSAPSSPTTGMVAMASGSWGGATTSTAYMTYYNGHAWRPLGV